jgi:hypothetical protein
MTSLTDIPLFPATRPLVLTDKPLFDQLFAELQPQVSECTFANLFLFRHAHAYGVCRVADAVLLLGRGYDGSRYFLPPLTPAPEPALNRLFAAGLALYGADAGFAERFLQCADLRVEADRDSFDYLYLREELATLPGSRFHKKKNRINYFTSRHAHQVARYDATQSAGCLAILDSWRRVRPGGEDGSLALEAAACAEALQLAEPLGLQGVVILVAGRVVAFALGERLNRETMVCHFEKADPFLEGAGQLVNREFCRLLFTDCRVVNREQDLGEPGLRTAKVSYHPVALLEKYRAFPRGEP